MTPPTPRSVRNLAASLIVLSSLSAGSAEAGSIYTVTDLGSNVSNLQLNNVGQVAGLRGTDGFLYSNGHSTPLASGVVPVALADNGRVIDGRGPFDFERERNDRVHINSGTFGNHKGVLVGTGTSTPYYYRNQNDTAPVGFVYQPNSPSAQPHYSSQYKTDSLQWDPIVAEHQGRGNTPIPGDPTGQGMMLRVGLKTQVTGINDLNQIVGSTAAVDYQAMTNITPFHVFIASYVPVDPERQFSPLVTLKNIVDLGTLGGNESGATSINNAGQVIGWANTASGAVHAFLYTGGKMLDIGVLSGKLDFVASALDIQGDVVGTSGGHAFVFTSGGIMEDLNDRLPATSGLTLDKAIAINDVGQILAEGYGADGVEHAVLLSPVPTPEPTTLALLGLVGVGYGVRRIRNSRR